MPKGGHHRGNGKRNAIFSFFFFSFFCVEGAMKSASMLIRIAFRLCIHHHVDFMGLPEKGALSAREALAATDKLKMTHVKDPTEIY